LAETQLDQDLQRLDDLQRADWVGTVIQERQLCLIKKIVMGQY